MKLHGNMQEKLKQEYELKGYSVEVEVNVPYKNTFFVVDLVAKKNGKTVAIEIGNCTDVKLKFLRKKFDTAINVSYLLESKDGFLKHICGYTWKPRVKNPKECPDCKRRISRRFK